MTDRESSLLDRIRDTLFGPNLGDDLAEVSSGLYVGSSLPAREAPHRFDRRISVAEGLEYDSTTHSFELSPTDADAATEFANAVDCVRESLAGGDTTLCHCHEGRERAPTVVATALAAETDRSFAEAVQHVRERRPIVEPTPELERLAGEYLDKR